VAAHKVTRSCCSCHSACTTDNVNFDLQAGVCTGSYALAVTCSASAEVLGVVLQLELPTVAIRAVQDDVYTTVGASSPAHHKAAKQQHSRREPYLFASLHVLCVQQLDKHGSGSTVLASSAGSAQTKPAAAHSACTLT
jgi:hypothetical protein